LVDSSLGERRARTNYRVKEFLAAAVSLLKLNEQNLPELGAAGVSFVNKLDTSDLHFIGHSFGGCTALTAASRRPDLASSVVAHEPAVDWMPDDARRSLFADHKLIGGPRAYNGGTGGFISSEQDEEKKEVDSATYISSGSLHDVPMLFLYSDEWNQKVGTHCGLKLKCTCLCLTMILAFKLNRLLLDLGRRRFD
jgi:S-formylglutathione hydrolase FrmB